MLLKKKKKNKNSVIDKAKKIIKEEKKKIKDEKKRIRHEKYKDNIIYKFFKIYSSNIFYLLLLFRRVYSF